MTCSTMASGQDSSEQLKRVTTDGLFKQRPVWSADQHSVVFARHDIDSIYLYRMDTASGTTSRLTDRKSPEYDAVFAPDDQSMLFSFDKTSPNQGDLEIYRIDVASGTLTPVAVSAGKLSHEESPTWSPDGKQLAFSSTRDGNQEIYLMSITGSDWTRLTTDPAVDAHPAWSPDGKSIAFSTNRWGDLELAVMNADGTNLKRLTHSVGLDDYPAWSPDGRYLAFTGNREGNLDIYVHRVSDGKLSRLTQSRSIDNFPAWTPGGQIGFVSNRDDGFDIYVTRNWRPDSR